MYLGYQEFNKRFPQQKYLSKGISSYVYTSLENTVVKVIKSQDVEDVLLGAVVELDVYFRLDHPSFLPLLAWTYFYSNGEIEVRIALPQGTKLQGQLPFHQVLSDILSGLRYLHSNGIAHNDVKLANIIVYENRARLIDFGLSSPLTYCGDQLVIETPLHTVNYRDPEIECERRVHVSVKAEVYGLGVSLAERYAHHSINTIESYPLSQWTQFDTSPNCSAILKDLVHFPLRERLSVKQIQEKYNLTHYEGQMKISPKPNYVFTEPEVLLYLLQVSSYRHNRYNTYITAVEIFSRRETKKPLTRGLISLYFAQIINSDYVLTLKEVQHYCRKESSDSQVVAILFDMLIQELPLSTSRINSFFREDFFSQLLQLYVGKATFSETELIPALALVSNTSSAYIYQQLLSTINSSSKTSLDDLVAKLSNLEVKVVPEIFLPPCYHRLGKKSQEETLQEIREFTLDPAKYSQDFEKIQQLISFILRNLQNEEVLKVSFASTIYYNLRYHLSLK
jgi:serine/threonine protein kinase